MFPGCPVAHDQRHQSRDGGFRRLTKRSRGTKETDAMRDESPGQVSWFGRSLSAGVEFRHVIKELNIFAARQVEVRIGIPSCRAIWLADLGRFRGYDRRSASDNLGKPVLLEQRDYDLPLGEVNSNGRGGLSSSTAFRVEKKPHRLRKSSKRDCRRHP